MTQKRELENLEDLGQHCQHSGTSVHELDLFYDSGKDAVFMRVQERWRGCVSRTMYSTHVHTHPHTQILPNASVCQPNFSQTKVFMNLASAFLLYFLRL